MLSKTGMPAKKKGDDPLEVYMSRSRSRFTGAMLREISFGRVASSIHSETI
jgi:hypothetical protein